ncbi:PilZ domain-containing protein [Lysinibacillus yapensis]|uniref:PilZ domain-containing protein n=1 Tax=Ureibacillus yapensis TaxID=2304605 RepID=A0A396SE51_9BACL|nr:PilZ domain-containing protein [Lysinibacillus yapensis]RHW39920.1 PilZ domain-containing protein [Lysinibacillus yapensis]
MQFKRNEGFRFVFNEPIDSSFKIIIDGNYVKPEIRHAGKILDISPHGVKLFSEAQIGEYLNKTTLRMELQFVLDVTMIEAVGEIMWTKPYMSGRQYGILFQSEEKIDELIIREMKLRRKKEMLDSKRR